IELQRLTGMRPGEVVAIRTADIDMSGPVWVYTPSSHKMAYRDRDRRVYIGPTAQAILGPWLKSDSTAFLFSPRQAREERLRAMRAARKTPVQPSQKNRKKAPAKAKRLPRERYSTRTYQHAILYGCAKAHPHPTLSTIRTNQRTPEQRAELKEWNRKHSW